MDYRQLMKQAAINQTSKIKKFEKSKEKEKEEKAVAVEKKEKEKRKANDKLHQYETTLVKSRLAYNGLLSRKGEPLSEKAKRQLEEVASRTKTPPTTTPKKVTLSVQKSSKSKSTSPHPTPTTGQRTKGSTPLSKGSSSLVPTKKSKTPPPRLKEKTAAPGPVNFKDLMKLAQKNNSHSSSTSSLVDHKREEEKLRQPTTSGGAVGIGKALLSKQKKDDKSVTATVVEKKPSVMTDKKTMKGPIVKGSTSMNGKNYPYGPPKKDGVPHPPSSQKKDYPYGPPVSLQKKDGPLPSSQKKKDYPYGPPPNRNQSKDSISNSKGTSSVKSGTSIRGGHKGVVSTTRPEPSSSSGKVLKSKSFYGSRPATVPSSARLIRDGPSSKSSSLLHYKSAWVDEMRDYLQNNSIDLDAEEDEYDEEMDDFVVDEEEEEGDYSSAIQEIFGSRYRTRADEEDDDRLMESSYTQQQFEEYRSARIGEMEDAEDLKREQEMMRRKRNKSAPPNKPTKRLKH